jgi:hypothetical protein
MRSLHRLKVPNSPLATRRYKIYAITGIAFANNSLMRDREARPQQPANNFELSFVQASEQIETLYEVVCIKADIEMWTTRR